MKNLIIFILTVLVITSCGIDMLPSKKLSEISISNENNIIKNGATISIGEVPTNTKKEIIFYIENKGNSSLELTGHPFITLTTENTDEFIVEQPSISTIVSGGSVTFKISITPKLIGSKTAKIKVTSNDYVNKNFEFYLTSEALKPVINISFNNSIVSNSSELDLGKINKNESKELKFTIKNSGNIDLILDDPLSVQLSGDNLSYFTIQQPNKKTLIRDETTDFTIILRSDSVGLKSLALKIPNNDIENKDFSFFLKSNIVQEPDIQVIFSDAVINTNYEYTFPDTLFGSYSTDVVFTIKNKGSDNLILDSSPMITLSGNNAESFVITQPQNSTIVPGSSTIFKAKFYPQSNDFKTSTLTLTSNDPDSPTFSIILKGQTVNPELSIYKDLSIVNYNDTIDFGTCLVDQTKQIKYIIRNTGTGSLQINGVSPITSTSNDFIITQPIKRSLLTDETTDFTITFKPKDISIIYSNILLTSNDSQYPDGFTFISKGSGIKNPKIELIEGVTTIEHNSSLDIGKSFINGTGAFKVIRIVNIGNDDLILTGAPAVAKSGTNNSDFGIMQPTITIVPAKSETSFKITFIPSSVGVKIASISINTNDPDNSNFIINISGNAVTETDIQIYNNGESLVSGGTVNFGDVEKNTKKSVTISIKNNGTQILNLTDIPYVIKSGSTVYGITQPSNGTIAPQETVTFKIDFTPTNTTSFEGQLVIRSNDPDTPAYSINLAGKGVILPTGKLWTRLGATTPFADRTGVKFIEFKDKIWAIGGYKSPNYYNDIWVSTDGIIWTEAVSTAQFTGRKVWNLTVFNNKLFLCGGTGTTTYKDLWVSDDGMSWTNIFNFDEVPDLTVIWQNKLWYINKSNKTFYSSSDGNTWVKQANSTSNLSGYNYMLFNDNETIISTNYSSGYYWLTESSDLINYTAIPFSSSSDLSGWNTTNGFVKYKNIYWFRSGSRLYYSTDLSTWNYYSLDSSIYNNVTDLLLMKNKLFLVGKEIWCSE